MAEKIIVKQVRSTIGQKKRHEGTLRALGLGRIGRQREHEASRSILGMVRSVGHLVEISKGQ